MKPRADFSYAFREVKGESFLMIEDLDRGRCSVTNDIENVVEYIFSKTFMDTPTIKIHIIYRDSMDFWNIYNYASQTIIDTHHKGWLQLAVAMVKK